jgi:hypothetical protein
MRARVRWLASVAATLVLGACVVYEPVAVSPGPTVQQRFDRSWAAAGGAMSDQGVAVTAQDRGAGVMRGERGGIAITATLVTMADGSIQVKLESSGATNNDPGLVQRVSESYERRMGR